MKLSAFEKFYLMGMLLIANNLQSDPNMVQVLASPLNDDETLSIRQSLYEKGCLEQDGDSLKLTKKGFALAYKLNTIGVDYQKTVEKGSWGNGLAAITGTWKGFKSKIDDSPIYEGSSAFNALVDLNQEIEEVLKNAVISETV